ncbi:MAG TPA: class IV adenylate cyclase [Pyrinomonadaceae bacterium]|nr:class IV adenylate cyclase [Pyrinomonadaceae bacterium]
MPIEIEKKFRLSAAQRKFVRQRLKHIGARHERDDVEENTLYTGNSLVLGRSILRLRRVNRTAILTFKERLPSDSDIKHQLEDETEVKDPEAMEAILGALGFTASLVYEKRREGWKLGKAKVVIDELPFGLFMEIEADEPKVREIERKLAVKGLRVEGKTYPQLTMKHGKRVGEVMEARFKGQRRS